MSKQYKHNHYVPQWYQELFLPAGQKNRELYYLDLKPDRFTTPNGIFYTKKSLYYQGTNCCFAEEDLYTRKFNDIELTDIEQYFFGDIDARGHKAVNYFANFSHPWDGTDAIQDLMNYIGTQKLRTPKGLGWLQETIGITDKSHVLNAMLRYRGLYGAIWFEAVWQIADASQSETKFIISDHPVTVYNKKCGPHADMCRGYNDPDIRLHGSHTIFPLSMDKVLILTNLSWVRNPYQSALKMRPNPNPWRQAIMKITDIQTLRYLSEQEVREINFIIKNRALRYVSSAKEEWLHPEKFVSKSDWETFGKGYLFMPDPRAVNLGGEIFWGNKDGTSGAMDVYGRRPWEKDYRKEDESHSEASTLYRFKGEFATLFGPYRRGRSFEVLSLDHEKDDDEYHQYHLGLYKKKKYKKKKKKRLPPG